VMPWGGRQAGVHAHSIIHLGVSHLCAQEHVVARAAQFAIPIADDHKSRARAVCDEPDLHQGGFRRGFRTLVQKIFKPFNKSGRAHQPVFVVHHPLLSRIFRLQVNSPAAKTACYQPESPWGGDRRSRPGFFALVS